MIDDSFSDRMGTGGFPVYVRKLDKKSTWGHDSDDVSKRLEHILARFFPEADDRFSLYLVNSDDELKRVVVGQIVTAEG